MRLEHRFAFEVEGPKELLSAPERVFSELPGIESLHREDDLLRGALCGEARLLGRFCFPFQSRLHPGEVVRLEPLPLKEERLWAELGGEGRADGQRLVYDVHLVLHAALPEGEKWGVRAFRRMAEAALAHALERSLSSLPKRLSV